MQRFSLSHSLSLPLIAIITLARRQLFQLRKIAVELIRIAAVSVRIRILPDRLIRPPPRDRTGGATVPRQHERTGGMERGALAGALAPPVIGGVDQRVTRRLGMILRDETLDPSDHGRLAQAVAGGAVGVVLYVEHAGQCDAVARPAAAMGKEECRLCTARAGVRVSKVVTASD